MWNQFSISIFPLKHAKLDELVVCLFILNKIKLVLYVLLHQKPFVMCAHSRGKI